MPDPNSATSSDDPRVNAALADYLQRIDRGEATALNDCLAQHADIAGELRSLLVTSEELGQLLTTGKPGAAPAPEVSTHSMAVNTALRSRPRRGYIGLANWTGVGVGTQFRNIRIRELDANASGK